LRFIIGIAIQNAVVTDNPAIDFVEPHLVSVFDRVRFHLLMCCGAYFAPETSYVIIQPQNLTRRTFHMTEFTRFEIYMLLNQNKPLWLAGSDLTGADLRWANLSGADLTGANLTNANLCEANLTGANLRAATLTGANLFEANLFEANLYKACLNGTNLTNAKLSGTNLTGADLTGLT
jgi:uncharacterized protein YjbI with pentapeptide repeats